MLRLISPILLTLALLAGCSTPDNSEPPAKLMDIAQPEFSKVLWSTDTGRGALFKYVDMTPLILGDAIYTIDLNGVMEKRETANGRLVWKYETGLNSYNGLSGVDKELVATSRDGDVVMFDLDEKGPRQRWSAKLNSEIRTSPVLAGAQLFIRGVNGKLSALDSKTGELQWTVSKRVPALSLSGSSQPVVTEELVIAGFDNGKLVAYNRVDGSVQWEHTVATPQGRSEIERLVDLDGQFIIRDKVIYISSYQGQLIAITLNSGQVLWAREFSTYQAMDIDAEAIYLVDDKSHLWSIDRRTGSAFWKLDELNARKLTAPRVDGDRIIVGDLQGYVHWIDKQDGRIVARAQREEIAYLAQPQLNDARVIMLDISGQMTAFTRDRDLRVPDLVTDEL